MKYLLPGVVLLALFYIRGAESFPNGAPAAACDDLTPRQSSPGFGHVDPPQNTTVPYWIDLSPFNFTGTLEYIPGRRYRLTLGRVDDNTAFFKGFFVQARTVADDSTRVGNFSLLTPDNTRLSSCPIPTDGVTHSTNVSLRARTHFSWTAPPQGTGPVRFGFSIVQVRNIYWANLRTEMISEAESETVMPTMSTGAAPLTSASLWTILVVALMGLVLKAFV